MAYKFLSTILGIDANFTGNVGVGTTTPGAKLDVNGNIRLSNNNPSVVSYTSYSSNIFTIKAQQTSGADIGGMIINTGSGESRFGSFRVGGGYYTTFFVNNSELIRLSTSNNVLIGSTTDAGFKLDINGTTRSQGKLTITTGGAEITGNVVAYTGIQSYGQVQIFSAAAFQMFNAANNSKASFQYINANGLLLTTNSDNISGVLKGLQVNPTMVASANNDVLVGLDVTPTFTNGAFTGVQNQAVRIQGNTVIGATSITNMQYGVVPKLFVNGDAYLNGVLQLGSSSIKINGNNISWENTGITNNLPEWRADATGIKFGNYNTLPLRISIGGTENVRFFSTGNSTFGGTTDAGYKLDVNGSVRSTQFWQDASNANKFQGIINQGGATQSVVGINATRINAQTDLSVGFAGGADASAVIQANSTTKGFLPPRMTAAQRAAISTPATGLIVYQTDSVEGVYVYTSAGWKSLTMV